MSIQRSQTVPLNLLNDERNKKKKKNRNSIVEALFLDDNLPKVRHILVMHNNLPFQKNIFEMMNYFLFSNKKNKT